MQCVKCGSDLKVPKTGRRPRYCGSGCRRAAEYELRRLQTAIENEENLERSYRQDIEGAAAVGVGPSGARRMPYLKKRQAWHAAEIARLEARMQELCSESTDDA